MHLSLKRRLLATAVLLLFCGVAFADDQLDPCKEFSPKLDYQKTDRISEADSIVGRDALQEATSKVFQQALCQLNWATENYKKLAASLPPLNDDVVNAKEVLAIVQGTIASLYPDKYGYLKQEQIKNLSELIEQLSGSTDRDHLDILRYSQTKLASIYFEDPAKKELARQLIRDYLDHINWEDELKDVIANPNPISLELGWTPQRQYIAKIDQAASLTEKYFGRPSALLLYRQGLAFAIADLKKQEWSEDAIAAEVGIAVRQAALGDMSDALSTYVAARTELSRLSNPLKPATIYAAIDIYEELARGKYSSGKYLQQIELLKEGYHFAQLNLAANNTKLVSMRQHLADAYLQIGDYSNAIPLLIESLSQARQEVIPNSNTMLNLLISIGDAYRQLGQYDLASPYYEESVSIANKMTPDGELFCAVAKQLTNELNKESSQLAQSIRESLKGKKVGWRQDCDFWTPVALFAFQKGEFDYANGWLVQVVNAAKDALGETHPQYAAALLNLVEYGITTSEQRINAATSSIAIGVESNVPEIVIKAYYLLSKEYEGSGDVDLAILTGKIAVNLLQKIRTNVAILGSNDLTAFLLSKRKIYIHLIELLIRENRISEAQQVMRMLKEEEYFDFIRRGATNEETTSADYNHAESLAVQLIKEAEESLRNEKSDSSAVRQSKRDYLNKVFARSKSVLQQSKSQSKRLELQNKSSANIQSSDARKLAVSLGKHTAIIQYVFLDTDIQIFLTTHDQAIVKRVPITKQVKYAMANFIDSLGSPSSNPLPFSKELYQLLINPIESNLINSKIKTIMLSLDGNLRRIPFGALYDGEHYLIEKYSVATFSEAAERHLLDKSKSQWKMAGFGVTKGFYPEFKALPSVRDELTGIIRNGATGAIPGQLYFDEDFTEAHFRESSQKKFTVFHVASHFKLKVGLESESFLLLGNGTRLSLADLRTGGYSFNDVDLMTLSACDTAQGGGTDIAGREIEGFSTLVQRQGTKSVLASLWSVADKSTAILMQSFYRYRTRDKMTKADALRQAQLDMITGESTNTSITKSYSHPYYWAPFVLMGNWL